MRLFFIFIIAAVRADWVFLYYLFIHDISGEI